MVDNPGGQISYGFSCSFAGFPHPIASALRLSDFRLLADPLSEEPIDKSLVQFVHCFQSQCDGLIRFLFKLTPSPLFFSGRRDPEHQVL